MATVTRSGRAPEHRVTAARRRAFAGRAAELTRFRALLRTGAGAVVFVHGCGGVGKTSLLHQFAALGARAGRRVTWLDRADPVPDPRTLPAAALLLIDDADTEPQRWLRDDVLTRLADAAIVVLAGRNPPPLSWRVDPGWSHLVKVMPLTGLDPADARALLAARGVPGSTHGPMLAFAHGHPLALALMADIHRQRGGAVVPAAGPEVITTLLAKLVDAVPGPAHRAALEACSQVRVLTEPLLVALLGEPLLGGPDPHELFAWLAGLSIVDLNPRGLVLHDLARDVLAAELRWRNPDRHNRLHRAAGGYYRRLFAAAEPMTQRTILLDFLHLHRDSAVLAPFLGGVRPGGPGADELQLAAPQPDDWPVLRELVRRYEGERSARIAERWFTRQPSAVTVVRGAGGEVAGFAMMLALQDTTDPDRATDPGIATAWRYVTSRAPLRRDEAATVLRYWIDAHTYQAPGPVQTLLSIDAVHRYLTTPALAYSLMYYADPQPWHDACAYADFHRLPDADFAVGERRFGAYWHDWRTVSTLAWLGLLAERETATAPLAVTPATPEPPSRNLDHDEFAAAVRTALRDLGRADRLCDSPLLTARLVTARAGTAAAAGDRAAVLQQAIRDAADALAASPRDRRAYRALHHTYLQPAGTQERAAELLGLPSSTYRRHLTAGITRLAEILWQRELDLR